MARSLSVADRLNFALGPKLAGISNIILEKFNSKIYIIYADRDTTILKLKTFKII